MNPEPAKPIPIGWTVAGAVAATLAIAALLYGSARAWRSSNLFGRQFRFPVSDRAAIRFGGTKCGGHLAKVEFGPPNRRGQPR